MKPAAPSSDLRKLHRKNVELNDSIDGIDAPGLDEVESLLAHHDAASGLLSESALADRVSSEHSAP